MCSINKIKCMKTPFFLTLCSVLFLGLFYSCNSSTDENQVEKTEKDENFSGELPEMSVYNLPANWTNQNGENIQLEDLRGDIVVAVMIYTSCKAACPRLVADVRRIHDSVAVETNKQVKYVFVSIDPEVDTPERLKEFAIENEMDNDKWIFLRGTDEDTREFATVLAFSYKRISPIDFSHSNIISIFDKNGVLVFQKEGLGMDDDTIIDEIEKLAESEETEKLDK